MEADNGLFEQRPQLRPVEVPENNESTYLLTRDDTQATSPSTRRSKDPTAFVVDRYTTAYKTKSDAFEVFPRAEQFINAENTFKCPVCSKKKANFFCPNCIRNGDFTHSKTNFLERFADKKLKFIHLKGLQIQTSNQVKKHFTNLALKDELVRKHYILLHFLLINPVIAFLEFANSKDRPELENS